MFDSLALLVFPLLMIFAALADLFTMTIPNRVSLVLIAAYLLLALYLRRWALVDGVVWRLCLDRYNLSVRDLRRGERQAHALACGELQQRAIDSLQVDEGNRGCARSAALLRRGACAGVHQPLA